MAAAYDYLLCTRPFRRWGLPHSDNIEFHILRTSQIFGDFNPPNIFRVSAALVARTDTLMQLMAHELVHLRQHIRGLPVNHGKAFKRIATVVCREHGWDLALF